MLYTEDGGQSWTTILQGESTSQLFDLAAVNGELLVGSANRGMLRYDENANKLVDANSGLFSGIVVAMGKSDQKIWTAGGDGFFPMILRRKHGQKPIPYHKIEIITSLQATVGM